MSKEQPGQLEELESAITETLALYGAEGKVSVTTGITRSGRPRIELHGPARKTLIDDLSVLERMLGGDFMLTASLLAKTLDTVQSHVSSIDLISRPAFEQSHLFSKQPGGNGNELLNKLTDSPATSIPTFYGSTSGLNMAEVLETVVCADAAQTRGLDTHVVFDSMGHTTPRAAAMLQESKKILPVSALPEYEEFCQWLGTDIEEQRIAAAQLLLDQAQMTQRVTFIDPESIFMAMGDMITTAKMTLIGRLQGADPHLLTTKSGINIKISELPHTPLKAADVLPNEQFSPQGFFYYCRDAILTADSAGLIITPLKLTSHANIYKILETYQSLSSLRGGSDGTIVAPIQKHRIQTRHQAHVGSDPCDATVLAYLARRNPAGFQDLMEAFHDTCRVLSIEEASQIGVQDKKLVVEEYLS